MHSKSNAKYCVAIAINIVSVWGSGGGEEMMYSRYIVIVTKTVYFIKHLFS